MGQPLRESTGAILGRVEEEVACIPVLRTEALFSVAEILSSSGRLEIGAICRLAVD